MRVADILKQCLTGEVRRSIAAAVFEQPAQIHRAADAAVGLLVAAIAQLAEQPEGARVLLKGLGEHDPLSLGDLHNTARGSQANLLMERGDKQLLQLFGSDFYEAAGRAVSAYGGLGLGTSKSILCLMMPITMTAVHRSSSDRVSRDAMTLCLAQEPESIAELMPAGFWAMARGEARLRPIAEYLKCQPDDSADVAVAVVAVIAVAPSPSTANSFLSRFIPWSV